MDHIECISWIVHDQENIMMIQTKIYLRYLVDILYYITEMKIVFEMIIGLNAFLLVHPVLVVEIWISRNNH